jgi:hypothetical protein
MEHFDMYFFWHKLLRTYQQFKLWTDLLNDYLCIIIQTLHNHCLGFVVCRYVKGLAGSVYENYSHFRVFMTDNLYSKVVLV